MKIAIDREIWWGDGRRFRAQLAEAKGADIELEISSPGGLVYEGLDIFNAIRDYSGKVVARVTGLAASMASYIVMSADEIEIHDNAVLMIHNPWVFDVGDYRELRQTANVLEGLAGLLGKAYAKTSGLTEKVIREWMDSEKWLFGDEIQKAGFADRVIETEQTDTSPDSSAMLSAAKMQYMRMIDRLKNEDRASSDMQAYKAMHAQETTKVQTLIFDKEEFSQQQAIDWAVDHDFKADKVDETENTYRLRQREPSQFDQDSFRTIDITEGVKAVIGRLRGSQSQNSLTQDFSALTNDITDLEPNPGGKEIMTLEELKAKHPEIYNQVVQIGVEQERSRVASHMKFLDKGIAVDYAKTAIQDGRACDSEAIAHYSSEALSTKDLADRIEDNANDVTEPTTDSDDNTELLAMVMERSAKKGVDNG